MYVCVIYSGVIIIVVNFPCMYLLPSQYRASIIVVLFVADLRGISLRRTPARINIVFVFHYLQGIYFLPSQCYLLIGGVSVATPTYYYLSPTYTLLDEYSVFPFKKCHIGIATAFPPLFATIL